MATNYEDEVLRGAPASPVPLDPYSGPPALSPNWMRDLTSPAAGPDPNTFGAAMQIAQSAQNQSLISDRITQLLKGAKYDPMSDVATAAIAAARPGNPSFGEVYNSINAQRIKEAEALQETNTKVQALKVAQDRNSIMMAEQLAKNNTDIGNAYKNFIENFRNTVDPKTFQDIATKAANALTDARRPVTNPTDAYHAMTEAIAGVPLSPNMLKSEEERNWSRYNDLRAKQRAGIPLSPGEQDQMAQLNFKFSKMVPTGTGDVRVFTPDMPQFGAPGAGTVPQPNAGTSPQPNAGNQRMPGVARVTTMDMPPTKPIPEKDQEDLTDSVALSGYLDSMERNLSVTGPVSGRMNYLLYKAGQGDDQINNFGVAREKTRASVQTIIKGIPSNYDATVFEATLPEWNMDPKVNAIRVVYAREQIRNIVAMKIGLYKGLGYQIPDGFLRWAKSIGADPDKIGALDPADVQRQGNLMADKAQLFSDAKDAETAKAIASAKDVKIVGKRRFILTDGGWAEIK